MPHRKASWAIYIWTGLMVAWAVTGMSSVAPCTGAYVDACQTGTTIGAGIALTFIGGLWFAGIILLSLVWFASRKEGK